MSYEEQVTALNKAITTIGERIGEYRETQAEIGARLFAVEQAMAADRHTPRGALGGAGAMIGAMATKAFDESPAFSSLKDWSPGATRAKVHASIRAIVTDGHQDSSGGSMPTHPERSGIFIPAVAPLSLLAALPSRPTNSDSVEHVRLTASGDAARQEKQGDEKAEIDFDGELVKANIVTIAGHTTASRQVLSDNEALQGQIDLVIKQKVLANLEYSILNGQGDDDIDGLLNVAVEMVATLENPADRIGETVTAMQTNGYNPDVIVMNPADWLGLTTSKDQEERYLFGSPTAPAPRVLWNVPVVLSAGIPAGQALVLDTAHITILDREQPSVMLSNSHKDYFTRNLVAILGELRAGLEVRDEGAVMLVELEAPAASS